MGGESATPLPPTKVEREKEETEMYYVIDLNKGYVTHEGSHASCMEYKSNASYLFGGSFKIVNGAKERNETIKYLKNNK